jgi:hypothetical protein
MKIKSILKELAKGALRSIPVANVVMEARESLKEDAPGSPKGQIDWIKVIGAAVLSIALLSLLFGYSDEETVKFISNQLIKWGLLAG